MRSHQLLRVVFVTGAIIVALSYLGLSFLVVDLALRAVPNPVYDIPSDRGMEYREIEFPPRGQADVTLRGWWIPAKASRGTVIWVHGLHANRSSALDMAEELVIRGLSVLAFDLRGHGDSDEMPMGVGIHEKYDVEGAIDFLVGQHGVESGSLIIFGQSFGGASALLAAHDEKAVVGVFTDSAFAEVSDLMVKEVANLTPVPAWIALGLKPGLKLVSRLWKGVDLDKASPGDAASKFAYPIGLTHCMDDVRIPFSHAITIWDKGPPGGVFGPFEKCSEGQGGMNDGHAQGYQQFRDAYIELLMQYVDMRLSAEHPVPNGA